MLVGDLICSKAWRKVSVSVNDDVVSNAFCIRTAETSNVSLNERMALVQSMFHNDWTEVKKQEGLRKPLLKRVVAFYQIPIW